MFTDKLAAGIGMAREARERRGTWEKATEKYLTKLYNEANQLRVLGQPEGGLLERVYTDLNVLDKISAERRYSLEELEAEFVPSGPSIK